MTDYLRDFLRLYHWDPAKALQRAIEARILAELEIVDPCLDVGCGDGVFGSVALADHRVVGVDMEKSALKKARRLGFYDSLCMVDGKRLPFDDNSFSTVTVNSVFEHVVEDRLEAMLSEIRRVLAPKGRVYITTYNDRFGQSDPLLRRLNGLGGRRLAQLWKGHRDRRLALHTLKPAPDCAELFKSVGLEVVDLRQYFDTRAERAFFWWTELQYLGLWRANLGAAARLLSRAFSGLGVEAHRRWVARAVAPSLEKYLQSQATEGSCCFFELRKADEMGESQ